METAIYYLLCAMTLGGALGVILARGYVNAAMSMLLSMLGAAGMMVMMGAYFVAFIMVSVYAGAVLVLFVFVVMLMGEEKDGAGLGKKLALAGLWVLLGAFIGWASPAFLGDAALRAGLRRRLLPLWLPPGITGSRCFPNTCFPSKSAARCFLRRCSA